LHQHFLGGPSAKFASDSASKCPSPSGGTISKQQIARRTIDSTTLEIASQEGISVDPDFRRAVAIDRDTVRQVETRFFSTRLSWLPVITLSAAVEINALQSGRVISPQGIVTDV